MEDRGFGSHTIARHSRMIASLVHCSNKISYVYTVEKKAICRTSLSPWCGSRPHNAADAVAAAAATSASISSAPSSALFAPSSDVLVAVAAVAAAVAAAAAAAVTSTS